LENRYQVKRRSVMKKIKVRNDIVAKIDDEDYEFLSSFNWVFSIGYAKRNIRKSENMKKTMDYMHRMIMNAKDGEMVDHINGDTLDNRRKNLRIVTPLQNQMNKKPSRFSSSRYKGVCWKKLYQKWESNIRINGRSIFLGRYDCEEDAAKAYNDAASNSFGEFARLNEIE
jgi:AP2-like factor (euAP2 lineage)